MAIVYIVESKPMPMKPLMFYMLSKHKEKLQRDNYIMDCLWASATGRTFSNDNNATYPRWHEVISAHKHVDLNITKESVKLQFAQLKRK